MGSGLQFSPNQHMPAQFFLQLSQTSVADIRPVSILLVFVPLVGFNVPGENMSFVQVEYFKTIE